MNTSMLAELARMIYSSGEVWEEKEYKARKQRSFFKRTCSRVFIIRVNTQAISVRSGSQ